MKDERIYLKHILRCIARIEEYTAGGRESFFSSLLIQDGKPPFIFHRCTLGMSRFRWAAISFPQVEALARGAVISRQGGRGLDVGHRNSVGRADCIAEPVRQSTA